MSLNKGHASMRFSKLSWAILLVCIVTTILSSCVAVPKKAPPPPHPVPVASTASDPVALPPCVKLTRDPVILVGCMDFGAAPLTMTERFSRVKSCVVYADTLYARQLGLNKTHQLTQLQWSALEVLREQSLTLCIGVGRDKFSSDESVKQSKVNALGQ
jgi:hypothetical protein